MRKSIIICMVMLLFNMYSIMNNSLEAQNDDMWVKLEQNYLTGRIYYKFRTYNSWDFKANGQLVCGFYSMGASMTDHGIHYYSGKWHIDSTNKCLIIEINNCSTVYRDYMYWENVSILCLSPVGIPELKNTSFEQLLDSVRLPEGSILLQLTKQ